MVIAGGDMRPVTAFGSIRASDIFHDRSLRKAAVARDSQIRRHYTQEICEQIEDFEHKMGWRMRSNLGPKWSERREQEREEERTMGIKRPTEPRPKSPLQHYDYSNYSETAHLKQADWPQNFPDSMGAEVFDNDALPRSEGKRSSMPPSRNGYGASFSQPASRSSSRGFFFSTQAQRSPSAGPLRNSSRLWTPHSMIEPIFLPLSSTQRSPVDHLTFSQQQGTPAGRSRRWEDGAGGKNFWDVKKHQLMGALQRTEGNKLGYAQFVGETLKLEHDQQVSLVRRKKKANFDAAHERGEYYARMKARADRQAAANVRAQWEATEARRLALGMDDKARFEESADLRTEIHHFESKIGIAKNAG